MKIISIDPSFEGATAIIVAEWEDTMEEPELTDFDILDFRFEDLEPILQEEKRLRLAKKLITWLKKQKPDLVICENYIMFSQQIGRFGQAFLTSELIGMITMACHQKKIPLIKPRSSLLYKRRSALDYYRKEDAEGNTVKIPKPKKFRPELTNTSLQERGFTGKVQGAGNSLHLIVGDSAYKLLDYKVGSKNDHALMALRHLLDTIRRHNLYDLIEKAEEIYNTK